MTMTLIESKTLATAAASIEFTSIPQTYTDLLFLASTRSSTAGASVEPCLITFNSNTTGYTARTLNGNSTAVTSASPTSRLVFNSPRTGTTANTFGNVSVYIPNYTVATNKQYSTDSVTEHNATEAHITIIAGLWSNTAAITSTLFAPNANNFEIGSTISLYGILKGTDNTTIASGGVLFYTFDTSAEGWTATAGAVSVSGGIMTFTQTASDPALNSPTVSFLGSTGRFINVLVKKVSTTPFPNWDGSVYYSTAGHAFSESFTKKFAQPTWTGDYQLIRLDMSVLDVGGSDWSGNTITRFRLDFAAVAADSLLIDSIWID